MNIIIKNGKEKTKTINKFSIEQYIEGYEKRKISPEQIARSSGLSLVTVQNKIREYYKKEKKIPPNYKDLPNKIANLLKSGYTEKQIIKMAEQRNMCILEEDFEQARKLNLGKNNKEDDEIPI